MSQLDWLNNLKVGDKVCLSSRYNGYYLTKVTRLTSTQVCIGYYSSEIKYNKRTGNVVGDGYSDVRLCLVTDEILQSINNQKYIYKYKQKLCDVKALSLDEIKLLVDTLEQYRKNINESK